MKRKILLINPPLYRHPIWDPIRLSQPLGLWSIGTHLQKQGHDVKLLCAEMRGSDNIQLLDSSGHLLDNSFSQFHADKVADFKTLDAQHFQEKHAQYSKAYTRIGLGLDDILAEVIAFAPDVIGISSCFTCNHQSVIELAQFLKTRLPPEIWVVVGGQHATAWPEVVFSQAENSVDFVVCGEGEEVFGNLVACYGDDAKARQLPGIAWQHQGAVTINPRPHFYQLNDYYDLEPDLMKGQGYDDAHHAYPTEGRMFTDMLFSVGCHRACSHCFSPVMRGKLRCLHEENIRLLLAKLKSGGYEELILQDDDLIFDPNFELLLKLFKEYGFSWQNNGGVELESLNESIVDIIISSGCRSIYVPFNPRSLEDRIPTLPEQKKLDLIRKMHDAGIYVLTSGIYGVPDLSCPDHFFGDMDRLSDTHVRLVREGYFDVALVFPLSILPMTQWWNKLEQDAQKDFVFDKRAWLEYSIFAPQIHPRSVSKEKMEERLIAIHQKIDAVQVSKRWFSAFAARG